MSTVDPAPSAQDPSMGHEMQRKVLFGKVETRTGESRRERPPKRQGVLGGYPFPTEVQGRSDSVL